MFSSSIPFTQCVIEEIGLEGLEGITLEGLWKRLSVRLKLQLPLQPKFTENVWIFVKKSKEVQFFTLPVAREPLKIFDRFANPDPVTGVPHEPVRGELHFDFPPRINRFALRFAGNVSVQRISFRASDDRFGPRLVRAFQNQARDSQEEDRADVSRIGRERVGPSSGDGRVADCSRFTALPGNCRKRSRSSHIVLLHFGALGKSARQRRNIERQVLVE